MGPTWTEQSGFLTATLKSRLSQAAASSNILDVSGIVEIPASLTTVFRCYVGSVSSLVCWQRNLPVLIPKTASTAAWRVSTPPTYRDARAVDERGGPRTIIACQPSTIPNHKFCLYDYPI